MVDIAVGLVETYLRLGGYLTLSEVSVFRRAARGEVRTVTDIDIVGLRLPGDLAPPRRADRHPELLLLHDPALDHRPDTIELIIGEVKQGKARLNPAIRSREALHSVLHRVRWLFPPGELDAALGRLAHRPLVEMPARDGSNLRIRLVAFGQSATTDLHTIGLAHIVTTVTGFLDDHEEILKAARFSSPAAEFLQLLAKLRNDLPAG